MKKICTIFQQFEITFLTSAKSLKQLQKMPLIAKRLQKVEKLH